MWTSKSYSQTVAQRNSWVSSEAGDGVHSMSGAGLHLRMMQSSGLPRSYCLSIMRSNVSYIQYTRNTQIDGTLAIHLKHTYTIASSPRIASHSFFVVRRGRHRE
ncbi:uncharacterized protein MEPE_03116 [Melanopsichium pennsylvanicum]|uniref:Uncharacterized protein n=1 Tax=Melanopsichium pennsylvanicum TaxID=63383 RepID=A0AAJ5C564_9BASI|nr:uncharacterized protein MEPE_03116 [Melanopsichium pennsylvanicum]